MKHFKPSKFFYENELKKGTAVRKYCSQWFTRQLNGFVIITCESQNSVNWRSKSLSQNFSAASPCTFVLDSVVLLLGNYVFLCELLLPLLQFAIHSCVAWSVITAWLSFPLASHSIIQFSLHESIWRKIHAAPTAASGMALRQPLKWPVAGLWNCPCTIIWNGPSVVWYSSVFWSVACVVDNTPNLFHSRLLLPSHLHAITTCW